MLYQKFILSLLKNYIIGSIFAVFGIGSVLMFTTTQIEPKIILLLFLIICVSVFIMFISEYLVFRTHMKPIKTALLSENPSLDDLITAYNQTHRFPNKSVLRILGPHLLGFALPAVCLSLTFIWLGYLQLDYIYIYYALIGAVLVAFMHAIIEYFHTSFAIEPVLEQLYSKAEELHGETLSNNLVLHISLKTIIQLSAIYLSVFPLMLLGIITHSRYMYLQVEVTLGYWFSFALIVAVSVGMALYSGSLLYKSLTNPVNHLKENMKKVESGQLTIKVNDYYSDEFSGLIFGFNHMVQGLNERDRINRQLNESFITTLAVALDARDAYTAGHSERVATYAVEIGKRAQLSDNDLQLLKVTALLHDIGKIGVSDSVLLKDGPLTEEEFLEIKKHPLLGIEILTQVKPVEVMEPYLPGVRSHHERIDGKGYPDQLTGDDIPLMGRILAVADAFDAMTSDRPYRKGMTVERALLILSNGKGTQWEADFVDYLRQWIEEEKITLQPKVEQVG
ncbi:HD domain-containing phosphohydrolase [Bacillus alkalicellulosilyticus]|uniref:HD domain-containing phosphohydrolase n=1 Tax=Alkalihalobacterium alkalicellulosilyticum TaxID=1912214 RepID=UPI00099793E1|nr:HD domain-containing phosphohydrolase [Bacillus alkalicellulosilyticus]